MSGPVDTVIGVDTGGTFTDLVLLRGRELITFKTPSTPGDFSDGITLAIEAAQALAGPTRKISLSHSSTVATNAVLEGKGEKTACLTTQGFRDVLEIGRQARPDIYDLNPQRLPPLVPRQLRREIHERVASDGRILKAIDPEQVRHELNILMKKGVKSVAICLLYSFIRPHHEKVVEKLARELGFKVSRSSAVSPEFREYERMSTTVLNAYVSPLMERYLGQLKQNLEDKGIRRIRVVQSNGGSLSARAASDFAVNTLLSGPAAGVMGALSMTRQALGARDGSRIITFDMGGTSTDVSLINGDFNLQTEGRIAGMPLQVPMLDIHTVGAGGGSMAYLDSGGALHVGPESSGADPGPACYGKGEQPTVTDANLHLGRLDPAAFLQGRMKLHPDRAERSLKRLGGDPDHAAQSILRIVNANMVQAIRVISVERGFDPRAFTLVSFGGAGGLHACELAAALGMRRVFIPRHPGVLSGWGALTSDVIRDFSSTIMHPADTTGKELIQQQLEKLTRQAQRFLRQEGFQADDTFLAASLDLRYQGQSFELNVPFTHHSLSRAVTAFHTLHRLRYGHADDSLPVTAVTIRVRGIGQTKKPTLRKLSPAPRSPIKQPVTGTTLQRNALPCGARLKGPLLVLEDYAATWVPEGWHGLVDDWGHLILEGSP